MTGRIGESRTYQLTHHFFGELFRFGILTEVGADSFRRMVLGVLSSILALGLLLARLFMRKYGLLFSLPSAARYREALPADDAFLIALPMWMAAFVMVLIAESLLPTDTDFRVLVPLPVTRGLVFRTKLLAVGLFAGLFVLATHLALTPLLLITSAGRWAERFLIVRVVAFEMASLAGSAFAVLAVLALNGVMRWSTRQRPSIYTACRSAILGMLILAAVVITRLPAQSAALMNPMSSPLRWAPPVWFLGVERVLVGDGNPQWVALSRVAAAVLGAVLVIAFGSYTAMYKHFDKLIQHGRIADDSHQRRARRDRRSRRPPAFLAVRAFTAATLRRGALQQGFLIGISACGMGLVANRLIGSGGWTWINSGRVPPSLRDAALGAPFELMFVMTWAIRTALVLPAEPRASWIFRLTEDDRWRADQLQAVAHVVRTWGVTLPLGLLWPVQACLLGRSSITALLVAVPYGWLWTELMLRDWRKIPFSCTYVPGKRFVPQALLLALITFIVYTTMGEWLTSLALTHAAAVVIIPGGLLIIVIVLLQRRQKLLGAMPLLFEDQLPSDVEPLRLTAD